MTIHRLGTRAGWSAIFQITTDMTGTYLQDVQVGHLVDGFRGHVIDSPNLLISLNVDRVIGDGFGDTEIDNLQSALDKNEIGRFEIGMNHVLLMDSFDSLQHLP